MSATASIAPAKVDRLQVFEPILRQDSQLRPMLPRVLQLGNCSKAVCEFMNLVARTCGCVNPSVRSCLTFTFRMAKENEGLPRSARFEVTHKSGKRLLISTNGEVRTIANHENRNNAGPDSPLSPENDSIQNNALQLEPLSLPATSCADIHFSGIDGVEWCGYANLQRKLCDEIINSLCVQDFLNAPEHLRRPWQLDRLLQFYTDLGNPGWIAPILDFSALEHGCKQIAGLRHDILDLMVNAGRLGFCPTQFLRKVIRPHIHRYKTSRDLHRTIDPMFRMLMRVQHEINAAGGDGSAANIFTLKYFARNIAHPSSKLLRKGFYDWRGNSCKIFDEIGDCWCRLFVNRPPRERSLIKLVIRAYGHLYLKTLVQIENPYEILEGFEHATRHLEYLSNNLVNVQDEEELSITFNFTLHAKAFARMERRLGTSAQLIKLLIKHMTVTERLINDHDHQGRYTNYLYLLATGAFDTPDDIDFYLEMSSRVSSQKTNSQEGIEFLQHMIRHAKNEQARRELIEFMDTSRILEDTVFRAWSNAPADKRPSILTAVDRFFFRFLYQPSLPDAPLPRQIDGRQLKSAIIARMVRSSGLDKREVLNQLECGPTRLSPPPAAFKGTVFAITDRKRHSNRFQPKPGDQKYLQEKIETIQDGFRLTTDMQSRETILHELCSKLLAQRTSIIAKLEALQQETNRAICQAGDNRKAIIKRMEARKQGLKQQMTMLNPFAEFCHFLSGANRLARENKLYALEAALTCMTYCKSLRKKHAPLYARLAISFQYRNCNQLQQGLPPYAILEGLPKKLRQYSQSVLDAMEQVLQVRSGNYFLDIFSQLPFRVPAGICAEIARLLGRIGLEHLSSKPATVKADFFKRIFCKAQGLKTLSNIKQAVIRGEKNNPDKLKVALIPARAPMDQFFGAVGENCTASHYNEIKRPGFIPVRIINTNSHTLEGYIHLLAIRADNKKYLAVPGIEPKTSFIDHVDANRFYQAVKLAIIRWAQSAGYDFAAFSTNWITWSNRRQILQLISADVEGKKAIPLPTTLFPDNCYHVDPVVPFWRRGTSEQNTDAAGHDQKSCDNISSARRQSSFA